MLSIKKALAILPVGLLAIPALTSCNNSGSGSSSKDGITYLKILNSEDYIYKYSPDEGYDEPDLTTQFEKYYKEKTGKEVRVIYDTFDTMENMYNTIKTGKTKYDLICASEYMIQKLARERVNGKPLIQKLDTDPNGAISNYYKNYEYEPTNPDDVSGCSPFVREKLKSIPAVAGKSIEEVGKLDDYAMCYMWGTLGILYNPTYKTFKERGIDINTINDAIEKEDWGILWDSKFNKTISIKDSMRDTYAIGVMHTYKNEFDKAPDLEAKNKIFNYGGEADTNAKEHINTVKNDLLNLRKNVFGFEVDSGKEDICTGKIGIDTAWSGDAVYSIEKACDPKLTEKPFNLYYAIPKIGTNLWFDCWCMQQDANKEVANEFLNFISDPEIAEKNMDYIGYTSPIAGSEIRRWFAEDKYGPESEDTVDYDVSYFFKDSTTTDDVTIEIDKNIENRQMAAQFPHKDLEKSLMIMQDYGENNDLILRMWEQVKHESLPNWAIALLSVEGAIAVAGIVTIVVLKTSDKKRRKSRKGVC